MKRTAANVLRKGHLTEELLSTLTISQMTFFFDSEFTQYAHHRPFGKGRREPWKIALLAAQKEWQRDQELEGGKQLTIFDLPQPPASAFTGEPPAPEAVPQPPAPPAPPPPPPAGYILASNSKPSKLFVGWDQDSPKERALTHDPDGWDCSKLASLAEVAELADAGLDESSLTEDSAGSLVENVRTGDCFELQEGVFVAFWEPGIFQFEDHFLFFVEPSTGKWHEIWSLDKLPPRYDLNFLCRRREASTRQRDTRKDMKPASAFTGEPPAVFGQSYETRKKQIWERLSPQVKERIRQLMGPVGDSQSQAAICRIQEWWFRKKWDRAACQEWIWKILNRRVAGLSELSLQELCQLAAAAKLPAVPESAGGTEEGGESLTAVLAASIDAGAVSAGAISALPAGSDFAQNRPQLEVAASDGEAPALTDIHPPENATVSFDRQEEDKGAGEPAVASPRKSRHSWDFYQSPAWYGLVALRELPLSGTVFEPCSGDGAIASILEAAGLEVVTNDFNPEVPADMHFDAAGGDWSVFPPADWIVTNPPFGSAISILEKAWEHATAGVALFLRQSFLEPTEARGGWLSEHLPAHQFHLPRFKFRQGKNGCWATDSTTISLYVWSKKPLPVPPCEILTRDRVPLFYSSPEEAPDKELVFAQAREFRLRQGDPAPNPPHAEATIRLLQEWWFRKRWNKAACQVWVWEVLGRHVAGLSELSLAELCQLAAAAELKLPVVAGGAGAETVGVNPAGSDSAQNCCQLEGVADSTGMESVASIEGDVAGVGGAAVRASQELQQFLCQMGTYRDALADGRYSSEGGENLSIDAGVGGSPEAGAPADAEEPPPEAGAPADAEEPPPEAGAPADAEEPPPEAGASADAEEPPPGADTTPTGANLPRAELTDEEKEAIWLAKPLRSGIVPGVDVRLNDGAAPLGTFLGRTAKGYAEILVHSTIPAHSRFLYPEAIYLWKGSEQERNLRILTEFWTKKGWGKIQQEEWIGLICGWFTPLPDLCLYQARRLVKVAEAELAEIEEAESTGEKVSATESAWVNSVADVACGAAATESPPPGAPVEKDSAADVVAGAGAAATESAELLAQEDSAEADSVIEQLLAVGQEASVRAIEEKISLQESREGVQLPLFPEKLPPPGDGGTATPSLDPPEGKRSLSLEENLVEANDGLFTLDLAAQKRPLITRIRDSWKLAKLSDSEIQGWVCQQRKEFKPLEELPLEELRFLAQKAAELTAPSEVTPAGQIGDMPVPPVVAIGQRVAVALKSGRQTGTVDSKPYRPEGISCLVVRVRMDAGGVRNCPLDTLEPLPEGASETPGDEKSEAAGPLSIQDWARELRGASSGDEVLQLADRYKQVFASDYADRRKELWAALDQGEKIRIKSLLASLSPSPQTQLEAGIKTPTSENFSDPKAKQKTEPPELPPEFKWLGTGARVKEWVGLESYRYGTVVDRPWIQRQDGNFIVWRVRVRWDFSGKEEEREPLCLDPAAVAAPPAEAASAESEIHRQPVRSSRLNESRKQILKYETLARIASKTGCRRCAAKWRIKALQLELQTYQEGLIQADDGYDPSFPEDYAIPTFWRAKEVKHAHG